MNAQAKKKEKLAEEIEFFKHEYGGSVYPFPLESSVTRGDAIVLFENFDKFVKDSEQRLNNSIYHINKRLKDSVEGENQRLYKSLNETILNVITEIIHYFNLALELFPALSSKTGDLYSMLQEGLNKGTGDSGGGWHSYTLEFGLPGGLTLALHFDKETQ